MNPIELYECAICKVVHYNWRAAHGCCCPVEIIYKCAECGLDYKDRGKANSCCLWKKL